MVDFIENTRNLKKVGKRLYGLRRFEVQTMNKISEDLENVGGWYNSKILHGNTNKLSSQSRRVPFKDRNKTRISDKEVGRTF